MATTTDVSPLKINYLTQSQYNTALANNQINANELYLTPADDTVNISIATNSVAGIVKPWYYHSVSSSGPTAGSNATAVTVNGITTDAGKYYAVEMDKDGRMFVNVPWTNANVTGTVAIDHGGTGATTAASARTNLGLGTMATETATNYLKLSGGTMTGRLLTSFKNSIAIGSFEATSTTVPGLCEELRYSSGCMGSFNLTTAYTLNNVTISTGWYNFIWVPHRTGGINGAANNDNCNYGTCYLSSMTGTYGYFVLRFSSQAIIEILQTTEFVNAPTANQVVIAHDAQGRVKTSGYTIATSVPANAIFTDTKNTAGSTNSTSKLYLIGATSQAANPTTNSYQYTYTNNGLLSALQLGLNLNGTEKAHLEWNDTDQSIDFVFA